MSQVCVLLAAGFEEIEALAPVDLLRRAGAKVSLLSITGEPLVEGAHGIEVMADSLLISTDLKECKMLILPGGSPGYKNLSECEKVMEAIEQINVTGGHIAAICAAPTILGSMGLLKDKKAVCFPGMEDGLHCKSNPNARVVTDGNITTAKSAGCAVEFGLELIKILYGEKRSSEITKQIVFKR